MAAITKAFKDDPVGTSVIIDDVVRMSLAAEAERMRRSINKAHGAFVAQQVASAKRALAREYAETVSKGLVSDPKIQTVAQWLTGIEKYTYSLLSKADDDGLTGADEAEFNRLHRRDSRGRFVRGINQIERKDPEAIDNPLEIAKPVRTLMSRNKLENKRDKAERLQAQYEQADRILREFGASFAPSERKDVEVLMRLMNDTSGEISTIAIPLNRVSNGLGDSIFARNKGNPGWRLEESLIGLEIDAKKGSDPKTAARVQEFNSLASAGGMALARVNAIPESRRSKLATALMPRGPEKTRIGQFFDRITAGGEVADSMGNDKLAAMARFVGTYGPEATRVLEPRLRQAAYRYRGTEKEPDLALMSAFNGPDMQAVGRIAAGGVDGGSARQIMDAAMPDRAGGTPKLSPVQGALAYRVREAQITGEPLTEDQLNLYVRSDVAASHLISKLPFRGNIAADLSRKAGNILPSQGVLIDADGDVVSQAVGFGDDTYLPFNYANLKSHMRGGQYVRTRVQGGLTGEDIAAAVGNGARMATVVSSSGVFSLEFDPNFRGGRAMTDKAASMYERYIKILDAVENSGLYTQDIDAREKSRIEGRAAELVGGKNKPEFREVYDRMLDEARSKATTLTDEEMDGLSEQAKDLVLNDPNSGRLSSQALQRQIDDVYSELEAKAQSEKASRLRLNAEGYAVALETLQQQFPYFIRSVKYEPLAGKGGEQGFLDARGQASVKGALRSRTQSEDKGYVRPGGLRAQSVQSGYYQTAQEPAPKRAPVVSESGSYSESASEGSQSGGPQAQSNTAPSAQPSGKGLSALAAVHSARIQGERDRAIGELSGAWNQIAPKVAQNDADFNDVKTADNATVASWYFSQTQAGMKQALSDPEKAPVVMTALRDKNAVSSAIQRALNSSASAGVGDYFAEGSHTLLGQTDLESATNKFIELVQVVSDASSVSQPFSPAAADETGQSFYTGDRPQNIKIGGVDIDSVDTPQKLSAVLSTDEGKQAAELARTLGFDDQGGLPSAAISQKVKEQIQALKLVPAIQAAIKNNATTGGMQLGLTQYIQTASPGIDDRKVISALESAGIDVSDTQSLMSIKDTQQRAKRLQQAWALTGAMRTLQMVGGGGVLLPKAQAEQWLRSQPQIEKSARRPRLNARQMISKMQAEQEALVIRSQRLAKKR